MPKNDIFFETEEVIIFVDVTNGTVKQTIKSWTNFFWTIFRLMVSLSHQLDPQLLYFSILQVSILHTKQCNKNQSSLQIIILSLIHTRDNIPIKKYFWAMDSNDNQVKLLTNQGKLLTKHKVPWFVIYYELTLVNRSQCLKIYFICNIFLSQYCASKCLVWIRP